MVNVDFALNPIADPETPHRSDAGNGDVLEIAVEVRGWTDGIPVHSPEDPGAVRGAVEKVLLDLGLARR